jgi:hypothetical protein
MNISEAQLEMRTRYRGGFYGQLMSGTVWTISAALAYWNSPRAGILTLVFGGFFIFVGTELLARLEGPRASISKEGGLNELGMQVAFVLPASMPLLYPVTMYRLEWFYPAMMVLLGAHYLPFAFLYGMKMFLILAAVLVGAGLMLPMNRVESFSMGAWITAAILFLFAGVGRVLAEREYKKTSKA